MFIYIYRLKNVRGESIKSEAYRLLPRSHACFIQDWYVMSQSWPSRSICSYTAIHVVAPMAPLAMDYSRYYKLDQCAALCSVAMF